MAQAAPPAPPHSRRDGRASSSSLGQSLQGVGGGDELGCEGFEAPGLGGEDQADVNSAGNGADYLGVAVISTLDDMRVTTSNGKILKRDTNGVLVPESLSIPSSVALRGITDRAGTRVACGDNGTVLMNTGSGWTTAKSQNSETLYSVCFDAADHGFVIGQQALLAEYSD